MLDSKVLFIQDVTNYIFLLKEQLVELMDSFVCDGIALEEMIEWIIKEEIQQIHNLCFRDHRSSKYPHSIIRNNLNIKLSGNLSILHNQSIKVPDVYSDQVEIELELRHYDLHIRYIKESYQLLPLPFKIK